MKITVFGTGYVGLVTGVCFAEMGNNVTCVDVDQNKLKTLRDGKSPIFEPGLDSLLLANIKASRINFTDDAKTSVNNADIIFIAVGTPPQEDGSADLQYVLKVADTIAEHMNEYKLVVTKSTVPVGTFLKVKSAIEKRLKSRGVNHGFDVASNPEFLREGNAIEDCLKPNRVVIGVESPKAQEILTNLYDPFLKNGNPILTMDPASSEMTKYAANAMLATKISLMNEFSRVCEKVGADIEAVRKGIGSDHRIGPHFIYAGIGYGGSCFPKDVSALVRSGRELKEDLHILNAVEQTNQLQRQRFIATIDKNLNVQNKCLAIWGVAFKPGTDDIREAPALDVIQYFLDQNFKIQVYDPVAAENAREYFKGHDSITFYDDQYDALKGADALIIPTEWKSFREPDFPRMKTLMKSYLIFDGRNIYSRKYIKEQGFKYFSIGRPQ
jgi:UDPglucose 6-dehydrogenase